MMIGISLLIISLIGIAVVVLKTHDKITYKDIIINVSLVLLGFSLAIIWNDIQEANIAKKERESLVTMIQLELGCIHGSITHNLKTIEANRKALEEGKGAVLRPLILLEMTAWESAKLRNNVFIKNTGDLLKLAYLYTVIDLTNEKIRFRENYLMSNQAMSNYGKNLRIIDDDIKQILEKTKKFHSIAQEFIHKEYPLVVKGYSFSSESGLIKKNEK